jgi:hypothetical protein
LEIELNEAHMAVALTKLFKDLNSNHQFVLDDVQSMWDIIEQLDSHSFSKLHRNVYFADFLRQIEIDFVVDAKKNVRSSLDEVTMDETGPISQTPSNHEKTQQPSQTIPEEIIFQLDVVAGPPHECLTFNLSTKTSL